MLYHQVDTNDFIKIFFNLEEMICLSKITKHKPILKIDIPWVKEVFDLYQFQIIDEIPNNLIECEISDYVCMFDEDMEDIDGSDFLFYYPEQKGSTMRLDGFLNSNLKIKFLNSNFYENKYYLPNDIYLYKEAIQEASNFDISLKFENNFDYFKQIIPNMPLIFLDKNIIDKTYSFDFEKCYYCCDFEKDVSDFLDRNSLTGYNIKSMLLNFNKEHQKYDINLLIYLCRNLFTEIYGIPNNLLFNILLKSRYKKNSLYEIKTLISSDVFEIKNFEIQNINSNSIFSFSQKNININRSMLLNFLRFRECVNV